MEAIRKEAVAGMFYPDEEVELRRQIQLLLDTYKPQKSYTNVIGIISPHAGYIYSGKSAAFGYNVLKDDADFETAIIISPSHREYFHGISIYDGDAYSTPLGVVSVNSSLSQEIVQNSEHVFFGKEGHGSEHALEVQLPFLQMIKNNFSIVPIVIGDQSKIFIDDLAQSLSKSLDKKVVVIVSSDLSHFYKKEKADRLDGLIEKHINEYQFDELMEDLESQRVEACGGGGIVALMKAASLQRESKAEVISHTDSSEVSGDRNSVVGYLSAVVYRD
ncbi:MAG: AmmeMemoRadiSam system protein B [Bacteroidota bacterium]